MFTKPFGKIKKQRLHSIYYIIAERLCQENQTEKIADFCGTSKAVCLNSATAALEMVLRILGVGPGDEVITSVYTYTASASTINHVGAKIVFVDTAKDSYEMDYEQLADAITEKTKVIVPVDIGGVICDYEKINKLDSCGWTFACISFHPHNNCVLFFYRILDSNSNNCYRNR